MTSLGTSNYDGFMNRATGNQKQFTLVLNENITTIKSYAFNSAWVSKVSGNTSALCKIEKQALIMNRQMTLAEINDEFGAARTNKKEFLNKMDSIIPWAHS